MCSTKVVARAYELLAAGLFLALDSTSMRTDPSTSGRKYRKSVNNAIFVIRCFSSGYVCIPIKAHMPVAPGINNHSTIYAPGMFMCHFWHNFDGPFNNGTYGTLPLMVHIYLPPFRHICALAWLSIRTHVP